MKRFTDSTKWDDSWFWGLTPTAKLLWLFLLDHCDNAGTVDFNPKIAGFKIGQTIKTEHLDELNTRLKTLPSGRLWIPKFIRFQFGTLTPSSNLHQSVLRLIDSHGLKYPSDFDPLLMASHTHHDGMGNPSMEGPSKGKGTGKVKVQGPEGVIPGSTVIPEVLAAHPAFLEAWGRWLGHLKQKRKPPTLHAQDLQLATLSKLPLLKAIDNINFSIEKNYQGIYERFENGSNNSRGSTGPTIEDKLFDRL